MFQVFPCIILSLLFDVAQTSVLKVKGAEHDRFVTTDVLEKTSQWTATINAGGSTGRFRHEQAEVPEEARQNIDYPTYLQGQCTGVPNASAIVKNTCAYRYYMMDVLENNGGERFNVAEIRLYYEDERIGLRTWPSSRIAASVSTIQGGELTKCSETQDLEKSFDRNSDSSTCYDGKLVRVIMDLSEEVALKHYTIISVSGTDRTSDPKNWKLYGMKSADPADDVTLLDEVPVASFPTGDWMCDPPWTFRKPETCYTTTTTTTTQATTTTTTSTVAEDVWCAYRWWCFEAQSVVGGESNEWGLGEVELRYSNTAVTMNKDRDNAWWLDAVSKHAATLLDNGTEPWQSIDGDPETSARIEGTYSAGINGVERKAFSAKLCIDLEEPKQATHVVFAAAPQVPIPHLWSFKATNSFPTAWTSWIEVAKWTDDQKSAFTEGQAGYSLHRSKLKCPQPQLAPCSMVDCGEGKAPIQGKLCESWACEESDQASCCESTDTTD